ncbi:MAG: 3-deoxy-7-phosphoheptulonate synthase, partial [Treponema sp.]|nr:3-deoxy-7-phosphoheptulonate synthase [Treponema sp.]
SHGTGRADMVPSMSLAAAAAGADGIIVEVHNDPPHALCDGVQALTPSEFRSLVEKIRKIREALA